ncbi:MAG: hypothetical protein ASARMPRED_008534 [Alectoria sarmentosa]|nr:MAG: hypothetical protein ASARMPRED_008534 [Alectoria sarmentosa]
MACLLDTPNEILLQIVNQLVHADIESFALSCKRIYSLSESAIINHREKSTKYENVTCGAVRIDGRQIDDGFHPTLLLRDFLMDDSLCLYPLIFRAGDCSYFSEQIMVEVGTALGDLEDVVRLKIQESPYIIVGKKGDWVKKVLAGHTESTVALLLSLLLNVKNVYLSGLCLEYSHLESVLARISTLSHSNRKRCHPLSKLSHGFFDETLPSTILGFAVLPSIRSLHGKQIFGFKWNAEWDRKSSVRKIVLDDSTLDFTTLNNLVTHFHGLKFCFDGRVKSFKPVSYSRVYTNLSREPVSYIFERILEETGKDRVSRNGRAARKAREKDRRESA